MDASEVAERVARIRESAGDPEKAHTMEDELWEEVLLSIARGEAAPAALAAAALKTKDIDFSRYCA